MKTPLTELIEKIDWSIARYEKENHPELFKSQIGLLKTLRNESEKLIFKEAKLYDKANPPEDMLVEFANLCIQYPDESRSGLWDECLKNWELF